MAAYIRPLGETIGKFNNATEDFTANGAITNGDFVQFDGAGKVQAATSGRIIGSAQSTVADGATVKVLISPYVKYLVAADTAIASTNVGRYTVLTGATGAQKIVNGSISSTTGQVLILAVNPAIDPVRTDATFNVVTIAQSPLHIS